MSNILYQNLFSTEPGNAFYYKSLLGTLKAIYRASYSNLPIFRVLH
nr:MAG TPA: hypothetical protein [Caudoviricetes sp.]